MLLYALLLGLRLQPLCVPCCLAKGANGAYSALITPAADEHVIGAIGCVMGLLVVLKPVCLAPSAKRHAQLAAKSCSDRI